MDLPPPSTWPTPTHAPVSMASLSEVATALRERQLVVLHIGGMSRPEAQRTIDCLSGFTLAIGGEQQRLGPELFCFAPAQWEQTPDQAALFQHLLAGPLPEPLPQSQPKQTDKPQPSQQVPPAPELRPIRLAKSVTSVALVLWAPVLGWDIGVRFFSEASPSDRPETVPLLRKSFHTPRLDRISQETQSPLSQTALSLAATHQIEVEASPMRSSQEPQTQTETWPRPALESEPTLLERLQGADGLGGVITLANLNEPPMPAAAKAERLGWQRSQDPLVPLPAAWRNALRPELANEKDLEPAEVVHLPAPHLKQAETIPMLLRSNGVGESLVQTNSKASQALVEAWAQRQRYSPQGGVKPVLLRLEPTEIRPSP